MALRGPRVLQPESPLPPPEAGCYLLGLAVALPVKEPEGLAGTWLSIVAPFMLNSGATVGFFLPDTCTVFPQRQNLILAVQVQGTVLKLP